MSKKRLAEANATGAGATPEASAPDGAFRIVGIGASAGGLAAFEAFFSGLPADVDCGMAFVLVQHLDPDHKSLLSELIRRRTRMEVFEVVDGMAVRPDCAYIIPPGRDLAFGGGALRLSPPAGPRGQRLPIDSFFRSLAAELRERAIGVVLSGTGSDGTLGVLAIKGEGGLAVAQSPESAEYDGMPRSALATGLVDIECPPEEMAGRIIAYAARAGAPLRADQALDRAGAEDALRPVFALLRARTGHDFSQYKPSTVRRRVERRLVVNRIDTVEDYAKLLQRAPGEAEALFRDLLIGVTGFFRDPEAFGALEREVAPELCAKAGADGTIRVWAPGCSTGEEAYSLAILFAERLAALERYAPVQIFATDIDARAIAVARAGVYPAGVAADIGPERLARFFAVEARDAEGGPALYRVNKAVRDLLVFSEQDLIKDPPFSRLDLVVCRNLLIYMNADVQKRLIPLFHYALKSGGFLLLGSSESIGDHSDLFAVVDRKQKLFRRRDDAPGAVRTAAGRDWSTGAAADRTRNSAVSAASARAPSLRELTEQALLKHYAAAAVLVDSRGDVLYLSGRAGAYLEPAQGEAPAGNLLAMAREGLRRELAVALHKARTQEVVVCTGLAVRGEGGAVRADVTVRAVADLRPAGGEAPLYLVVMEAGRGAAGPGPDGPGSEGPAAAASESAAPAASAAERQIAELRRELRAKEDYLQTANEELETSNEELKSSNEEMQSVNEELQSSNEELETSKEELQSVNEELSTVNAELQTKLADLSRANNDMNNLLAGTGIATVFVDFALRIVRFTPAATRIINLIQSDVGRPVDHLVSNLLGYDDLAVDTKAVLDDLMPKEVEVRSKAGVWYLMRILPYRTLENVIEGAVLTFVDIDAQKAYRDELRFAQSSIEVSDEAVVWFNPDGACRYANAAARRLFGYAGAEFAGRPIVDIDPACGPEEFRGLWLALERRKELENGASLRTKDGRVFRAALSFHYLESDGRAIACLRVRAAAPLPSGAAG